jgi:hypothetical protein
MLFLGNLLYIIILLINAVAILSQDRFLARINLSQARDPGFGVDPESSAKGRIVHLISSVQTLLRVPLIVVNVLIIAYELVLG